MKQVVSFTLNGLPAEALAKPTDTLLDVLREDKGLTGAKRGCDHGDCGACMVLINGLPANACLTIALTVEGKEVVTVEGLTQGREPSALQKAFHEHGASQCGFCTPGMLMAAKALLDKNPTPAKEEIINALSGNLCRCGTYLEVIEAIQAVGGEK